MLATTTDRRSSRWVWPFWRQGDAHPNGRGSGEHLRALATQEQDDRKGDDRMGAGSISVDDMTPDQERAAIVDHKGE